MDWSKLSARTNRVAIQLLGRTEAIFRPQDGSASQVIYGLQTEPSAENEFTAGGGDRGSATIWFFIHTPDITPRPRRGDNLTIADMIYVIEHAPPDTQGGCTVRLRVC